MHKLGPMKEEGRRAMNISKNSRIIVQVARIIR